MRNVETSLNKRDLFLFRLNCVVHSIDNMSFLTKALSTSSRVAFCFFFSEPVIDTNRLPTTLVLQL